MSDERRDSLRKPVEGEGAVGLLVSGHKRLPVLLLDESVHGLGMVAVRPGDVRVGGEVVFESAVRRVRGRIGILRHVTEHENDICRIGVEWTD